MKNIFLKTILLMFHSCILLTPCTSSSQKVSNNEITFWGDSMTAGAGGESTTISATVEKQLERKTNNFGVGGLMSENIATLQGGLPLLMKIENNNIPASGDVIITEYNVLPYNYQTSQNRIGYLNDIKGELIRIYDINDPEITDHFIFRRSIEGNEVNLKEETPFVFEDAINHTNDITVIWAGRNDPKTDAQISLVKSNILAMVKHLNKNNKKYVVISVCNGDSKNESVGTPVYSNIISLNNTLKKTFENNYLDLRKYMVEQAIYDAGIIPTQQDLSDINSDCIPTGLRSDAVHFNAKGYEIAGKFIAKFISDKGW